MLTVTCANKMCMMRQGEEERRGAQLAGLQRALKAQQAQKLRLRAAIPVRSDAASALAG